MSVQTPPQHQVLSRGLPTAWIEDGELGKPILVFLHGFPDSAHTWQHQFDYFKQNFHVVAPFGRGAGPSAASPEIRRYGSDSVTLDLLQVLLQIDPTKKNPVLLVGHDLGCVHATNLAPLLGERLRGIVLLNGMGLATFRSRIPRSSQAFRSWYMAALQLPHLPEAVVRFFPDRFLQFAQEMGRLPVEKRAQAGLQSPEFCKDTLHQYRALMRDLFHVPQRVSGRIQCPLLVLWGKDDPLLNTPCYDEWEEIAADVTCRLLPCGHWPHLENPEEVNRLMDKFLQHRVFSTVQQRQG